jgi:hypothetical protein
MWFYVRGLTDFLYQRDREITALERPDLVVAGTGCTPVAQAINIRAMRAV